MTTPRLAAVWPHHSADWVGYQIWSANRDAHSAKSPRDRRFHYRVKDSWIEYAIHTLDSSQISLGYQIINGDVSVLVTINGESRRWVAHTFVGRLTGEARDRVLDDLGDPSEFRTDLCA
jgi:hypothetical protein